MFNIILYLEKTKLLKGNKALDFGCGAGRISKQLVEHGFSVDAVDIKPQEIKAESPVGSVNFVPAEQSQAIRSEIRQYLLKTFNLSDRPEGIGVLRLVISKTL